MNDLLSSDIHPSFKLNRISYSHLELKEVAYSLVKEGTDFELSIGDFLLDWLSNASSIAVNTSGVTAMPKQLQLEKQSMVNSAIATGNFLGLQEGNRALLCLSPGFIAGKMMLVRAMVLGLELDYIEPSSSPLNTNSSDYDFAAMVPMQLQNSLENIEKIKTLIVGGAPVSEKLRIAVQDKETVIYETFGMTETITHIALKKLDKSSDEDSFKTLPGITVSIDERGCLIIKAPEIVALPVHTNDLVKIISKTAFKWLGRYDHMINSGGIKLLPEPLEDKIAPLLKNSFYLAGLPDETLGQKLVLLVEGDLDTKVLSSGIQSLTSLEKFEKPKDIYCLPAFVRTENGKIRRSETLALLRNGQGV